MMPSKLKYPDFVPDQLLTSENLNDLFRYADEQGRMTRANLFGIGIVCGFEVNTASDGSFIMVSKGTGITSEGYLVAEDKSIYTRYIPFDPAKELYYGKYLSAANQKQFGMWELKRTSAIPEGTPLTLDFLNGGGVDDNKMVVMLFVELLREQNKNCNPESCDDKGITIRVNLRTLLACRKDVEAYGLKTGIQGFNSGSGAGSLYYNQNFATLAQLRMRRFNVAATTIVSAAGLLTAYKKILSGTFLASVEHVLTLAWSHFKSVIGNEYQEANPFAFLAEKFAFINNGSISFTQLRNLQYIYGHFSDLVAAYEEFRRTGMEVLSTCCPDADLFPRHLLLDLAIQDVNVLHSRYRHHFRYSPLFQKRDLHGRLRSLFRRMVFMVETFKVPKPSESKANPDDTIRITPSRLDPSPLSDKAIPYYYEVGKPAANALLQNWSYEKSQASDADNNLSYHAGDYFTEDFVNRPLFYDLEPYNFLRVEGHLGNSFSQVLLNLKRLIKDNRLPIDVVGLCLGTDASDTEIVDPKVLQDIQVQYEVLKAEVICCLKRQVGYWGKLTIKEDFRYGKLNLASNLFKRIIGSSGAVNFEAGGVGVAAGAGGATVRAAAAGSNTGTKAEAGGNTGIKAEAGVSRKADVLTRILGKEAEQALVKEYLRYQELGDYNLSRIPAPAIAFDEKVISHFALQILDEVTELLVLLEAENPITLDVEALTRHGKTLENTLDKLLELVDKELISKKPVQKIKAYVGEAQHSKVDAIAEAMPDMDEDEANNLILLLLNMPETEKTTMINQIRSQKGNRANQAALIDLFYGKLDKDGMMVPAIKEVPVVEDPFLKEMRDRLKNFNCLCSLAGFSKLRDLLRKVVEELKQANLFSVFTAKHPGIQHKAGVTMGGTFIVAYVRKGTKSTDKPDAIYDKVATEFPDGMVVADFYLPYLSYSNHPPVVYQVSEAEPIPEEVTLALQPNPLTKALRYSVGDETPYSFSHFPNMGALTNGTPANGVTSQGADNFVFTPSMAKNLLGNDFKVDIAFNYVKRGVSSDKVSVTVFNLPKVEIKPAPEKPKVRPGEAITIKATTEHADTFSWIMQDATGKAEEAATSKDLGNFVLAEEGTFSFTLRVTQSETGAQAISKSVTVEVMKDQEAPARTCGNLLLILEAIDQLPAVDRENYPQFKAGILEEFKITEYLVNLRAVSTLSSAEQNEFFKSKMPNGQTQSAALEAWLAALAARAVSSGKSDQQIRLLVLELYRILAELVMYMSCLRKEDLGKAEEQIFANMILQLKGQGQENKGILSLKDLSDAEKGVLARMHDEFNAEAKRNAVNNKINPKPKYARVLKAVEAVF